MISSVQFDGGLGEELAASLDLRDLQRRIAHDETDGLPRPAWRPAWADQQRRDRIDADAFRASRLDQCIFALLRQIVEPRHHVQAGRRALDPDTISEPAAQRADQCLLTLGVAPAHAPDVAVIGAAFEHRSESVLFDQRRVPVHDLLGGCERGSQPGGHDQVADPQGRGERLGDGAEIDHVVVALQRVQRRDRPGVVAILAVVIVLDHVGVVLACPGQQLVPASIGMTPPSGY